MFAQLAIPHFGSLVGFHACDGDGCDGSEASGCNPLVSFDEAGFCG